MEKRLDRPRDESRLAVKKEEGDHAHQRRQHDRQRDEPAEGLRAGEIEPLEQKRERDADRRRQNDAHQGYPDTGPERGPLAGPGEEVPQRRGMRRFGPDDDNGVDHQPGEQQHQRRRRELGSPQPHGHSAITRVASTYTRSPSFAASGSASTSKRWCSSSSTTKNAAAPMY